MISNSAEVSVDTLYNLVDPKNPELLKELGGTSGLAEKLGSSIDSGLKTSDIERQVSKYGTNILPEQISKSFFAFVWEGLHDKTLMVLMVAAAVELAIGVYKTWFAPKKDSIALIDGGAILIAVVIVVMFGAVSDFRKQAQFKALSEFGKSLTLVKALRDGEWIEIHSNDVVVGDIIDIQTGDIAPADAVLVSGFNVACDESAMTGEPMSVNKDLINEPFIISGTNVVNGVGRILVIGTGINSLNGRSMLALEIESEETPLQQKLNVLADAIAKFAFYLAITMIVILGASYFIVNQGVTDGFKISSDLTVLLILAVTVVVVAVPEGLPLAVTLSLAHATIQMLKDNNLVRHLSACETMGNATTICSDKTGTLTLNKMTVVRASIMEKSYIREESKGFIENLTATPALKSVVSFIAKSMNVNCTAEESKGKDGNSTLRGSKTEIAILEFWNSYGFPFVKDRASTQVINIVPFSSDRKRMTTVVKLERNEILESTLKLDSASAERSEYVFVKGASEIVLKCCTRMVNSAGEIVPLTPDLMLAYNNLISEYASEALRTICCAFKPYKQTSSKAEDEEFVVDDDSDLILVTILGILDPLRDEVPAAVAKCQNAGVIVRMVTGDSAPTARAIAKGCGILSADGLVMEGPDFRKLTESELDVILPKLQVLARSSPVDKQILVRNLKRLGETVAVTGDGTNDAPALAAADVGFSMGIAGTEVAKQASDIILMDDNFASLERALLWGRCVYDAIRKFLQFQLTVNVSAVIIVIVTSLHTTFTGLKRPESVLTAIQLLWVNLIMDTLAALALATDDPTEELLQRPPSKRTDTIVNSIMFVQIIGQAIYQIIVCLLVYFIGPTIYPVNLVGAPDDMPPSGYTTATLVFNTFIFCQVFNEFNSRSISRDKNIFRNLFSNYIFMAIIAVTVGAQIIIVNFGGIVFRLNPLDLAGWAVSVALGTGSIVVGYLLRHLPDVNVPVWLLGGGGVSTSSAPESAPKIVINPVEEETITVSETKISPRNRWDAALKKTKMQNKVIRVFRLPSNHSLENIAQHAQLQKLENIAERTEASSPSYWERLRLYIVTIGAFRQRRGDPSDTLLIDPRRYHNARVQLAKQRSKNQVTQ